MFEIDEETGEPLLDKNGNPIPKKVATKAQQKLVQNNLLNALANNIGKPLERKAEKAVANQIARENYEAATGGDYAEDVENNYSSGNPIDINTQQVSHDQKEIEQIELLQSKGLSTVVGADQYDLLAEQQSGVDKWANGIAKYGLNSLIHTAGGVGGLFYNLPAAVANREMKSFYDNDFNHLMESLSSDLQEWLPNYVTREEAEYGALRSMWTANFWANDVLGGMSFITGAVLSGFLTGGVGTALGRMSSGLRYVSALSKTAKASQLYNNTGAALNAGKNLIGGGAKLLAGSGYEASLMANEFVRGGKEQFISEFENEYGRQPNEEEMAAKMKELYETGNGVFAANMALVNISNMVTLPQTFGPAIFGKLGRSRHAAKGSVKMASELSEAELKQVAKTRGTTLEAFKKEIAENPNLKIDVAETWSDSRALLERSKHLVKPFSEMGEEMGQGWIDKSALNYVSEKYNEDGTKESVNLMEAMGDAFVETLGDSGAWKEGIVGLLLGAMGSPTFLSKKGAPKWQGGIYEAFKNPRSREEIQRVAKIMSQDEYTLSRELIKAATKLNMTNQEFEEALHSGDMFRIKNAEARSLFTIAAAYNNAGMMDVFTSNQADKIKGLTVEEFRNEFGYENMSDEDIKIRKEEVIKSFENQAKNIKNAMDKASYYVDSNNQRDLHEAISFSIFTSKNLDERETQLAEKLNKLMNSSISPDDLKELISIENLLKSKQDLEKDYVEKRKKILAATNLVTKKVTYTKFLLNDQELEKVDEYEKEIERLQKESDVILKRISDLKKSTKTLDKYNNNISAFEEKLNQLLELKENLENSFNKPDTSEVKEIWEDLQNIAAYREQLITEYNWLVTEEGNKKLSKYLDEIDELKEKNVAATRRNERLNENYISGLLGLKKGIDPSLRDIASYVSVQQLADIAGTINETTEEDEEKIEEEVINSLAPEEKEIINNLGEVETDDLQDTSLDLISQYADELQTIKNKKDSNEITDEEAIKEIDSYMKKLEAQLENKDLQEKITNEGGDVSNFNDKIHDLLDQSQKYKDLLNEIKIKKDELKSLAAKPIIDYPSQIGMMFSRFLTGEDYKKAYEYLNNATLEDIQNNVYLKFESFPAGGSLKSTVQNPIVSTLSGYKGEKLSALLYVNTPEGPIKIGAVPDVRRFKLNLNGKVEDFNPLNELHISAINPTFTHKVGNILQLTSEGKYFQELYINMEKIYPELDAYADRALKGEDVTVTNGELKNFIDFNWQFNFIQNLNRTKLSDLGSYADFESEAPGGVVNGKRVRKSIKGKLIRTSGKNKGYYIYNNEGITDVTSYLDSNLLNELEKSVTPDIETGHMTFYNKRVKVKNPDGTFSYVNKYVATGLKYPNNTNNEKVNKEFSQSFKSIVENFESVRQEARKEIETEGTRLNDIEKSMKSVQSSNISDVEKKSRLDQLGLEMRAEIKENFTGPLEKLREKWFFGITRKVNTIEYPIDSIATVKLSGKANEVQFMFTMNGFTNAKGDYVPFKVVNTKGDVSNLTLLFNVKEVTNEGVVLYTNAGKTSTALIKSADDLLNIINKNLESRTIVTNEGEIHVPKVSSINKIDDNDLGNMIPDTIKNPFNISLSGDAMSKVRTGTSKSSSKPEPVVVTTATVKNKSKEEMGLTDEELRGDIFEADFTDDESSHMNSNFSDFGVQQQHSQKQNSSGSKSSIEVQKAEIERGRQEELNKYNSEKNKFNKDDGKGDYVITAEGNLYIDEINAKYDAKIAALEGQSNTSNQSEIETQKADIERRRQESLYIVTQKDIDEGNDVGIRKNEDGSFEGEVWDKNNVLVESYRGTLKEVQDKINAKYDAELAALESNSNQTSQPEVQSQPSIKPPRLKTIANDLSNMSLDELKNVRKQLRQKAVDARQAEKDGKTVLGGSQLIEDDYQELKLYIEKLESSKSSSLTEKELSDIIINLADIQSHPAEGPMLDRQMARKEEYINKLKSNGYTEESIQKLIDDKIKEDEDIPMFSFENRNSSDQITIDTAITNLREILPANVPVQEVQQILHRLHTNGVPTGLVWNKVLYLDKAIKPGTEYHEAFHFVFRYFLTANQRNALLRSARSKYDKPTTKQLEELRNQTDLRKGFTNKQLSDIYYEEKLADGFMEYKKNPNSPEVNKKYSGIKGLFKKLLDKIKAFFKINKEGKKDIIDTLYDEISLGKFKNAKFLINNTNTDIPVFSLLDNGTGDTLTFQESTRVINTVSRIVFNNPEYTDSLNNRELNLLIEKSIIEFINTRLNVPSELKNNLTKSTLDKLNIFTSIVENGESIEKIKEGVKEIIKYQVDFNLDEEGDVEDLPFTEDELAESFEKDITQVGGFNSLSRKTKNYLTTVVGSYDMFGIVNELNLNKEEMSNYEFFEWGTNPIQLHTALTNLLKNSPKRLFFMRIAGASKTSPIIGEFFEKFKSDIGNELEIEIDDNTPIEVLEKSLVYNTIASSYEKVQAEYAVMLMDKSSGIFSAFKSDANDSAKQQIDSWANNWITKNVSKEHALKQLNKALEILKESNENPLDSEEIFNATVKDLVNIFNSLEINLSEGYLRTSLIQSKISKLDPTIDFEANLLKQIDIFPEFEGLTLDDINGFKKSIESSGNPFEKTVTEEGIVKDDASIGRLLKIANYNATFDETVDTTTFRNAEDKIIYKIIASNYFFSEINAFKSKARIDSLNKIFFDFLPNGKEDQILPEIKKMLGTTLSYVSDEEAQMFWLTIKNSSLLRGIHDVNGKIKEDSEFAREYLEHLETYILDGMRITSLKKEGDSISEVKDADSEASTFSKSTLADKMFFNLALFAKGTNFTEDNNSNFLRKKVFKSVKGVKTKTYNWYAPFLTQVVEAKRTQLAVNMPIQELVSTGNKLTDIAKVRLRNAIQSELDIIKYVKEESNKIISNQEFGSNLTKNFYYTINKIKDGETVYIFGNEVEQFYIKEGSTEKFDIDDTFKKSLENKFTLPKGWDLFEFKHLSEFNNNEYKTLLSTLDSSHLNNDLLNEYADYKVKELLDYLSSPEVNLLKVNEGEDKEGNVIKEYNNLRMPEFYGKKNESVKENILKDFYLNDFLNSIELNSLVHGPMSRLYKDSVDVVKRNGRLIASGPSIGNSSTKVIIKKSVSYKDRKDKGTSKISENDLSGVDTTDAQVHAHILYALNKYLPSLGKNDKKSVEIYKKLIKGHELNNEENNFLSESGNTLRPLKLVGAGRMDYMKCSVDFLMRGQTSYLMSDTDIRNMLDVFTLRKYDVELLEKKYESSNKKITDYNSLGQLISDSLYDKMIDGTISKDELDLLHTIWKPIPGAEEHHNMLNELETEGALLVGFDSAFKVDPKLGIFEISDSLVREQVETSNIKSSIVHGTQLMNLITSEQDLDLEVDFEVNNETHKITLGRLRDIYLDQISKRVELGMDKFRSSVIIDGKINKLKLVELLNYSLESSAPDPYLKEILSYQVDADGNLIMNYDLNLPIINRKVSEMFLSMATKDAFKAKTDGSKLTLKSDYANGVLVASRSFSTPKQTYLEGDIITRKEFKKNPGFFEGRVTSRRLEWRREESGKIFTEIKMTAQFAAQYNLKLGDTIPEHLLEVLGVRIPTQDKHSMIYAKVVEFLPPSTGNIVIMPPEIIYLSGADFDIDSLYARFRSFYGEDYKLFGSYENIQEAFDEYLESLMTDKKVIMAAKKLKNTDGFNFLFKLDDNISDELNLNLSYNTREKIKKSWKEFSKTLLFEEVLSSLGYHNDLESFTKEYGEKVNDNIKNYKEGNLEKINPITKEESDNILFTIEKVMLYNKGNEDINSTPATMEAFDKLSRRLESLGIKDDTVSKGLSDVVSKSIADNNNNVGKDNIGPAAVFNVVFQRLSRFGIGKDSASSIFGQKGFIETNSNSKILNSKGERINDLISTIISAMTDNAKDPKAAKFNLTTELLGPILIKIGHGMSFDAAMMLSKSKLYKVLGQELKESGSIIGKVSSALNKVYEIVGEDAVDLDESDIDIIKGIISNSDYVQQEQILEALLRYENGDKTAFSNYITDKNKLPNFVNLLRNSLAKEFLKSYDLSSKVVALGQVMSLSKGLKTTWAENDSIDISLEELGIKLVKDPGSNGLHSSDWSIKREQEDETEEVDEGEEKVLYDILPILGQDAALNTYLKNKKVIETAIASQIFITRSDDFKKMLDIAMLNLNSFYTLSVKNRQKLYNKFQSELTMFGKYLKSPSLNPTILFEGEYDPTVKRRVSPIEKSIIALRNKEINGEKPFLNNILLNSIKFTSREVSTKNNRLNGVMINSIELSQSLKNKPDFEKALQDASLALSKDKDGLQVLKQIIGFIDLKDGGLFKNKSVLKAIHPKLSLRLQSQILKELLPSLNEKDFMDIIGLDYNKFILNFLEKYMLNPANSKSRNLSKLNTTAYKYVEVLDKRNTFTPDDTIDYEGKSYKILDALRASVKNDRKFLSDKFKLMKYDADNKTLEVTSRPDILYYRDVQITKENWDVDVKVAAKKTLSESGFKYKDGKNVFPLAISVKIPISTGLEGTVYKNAIFKLKSAEYTHINRVEEIDPNKFDWISRKYILGDTAIYEEVESLGLSDFELSGLTTEQLIDFTKKAKDYKVGSEDTTETTESGPSSPVKGAVKEERFGKESNNIEILTSNYTRESVQNDTDSMYLFTDNAQRTSRPTANEENVDKNSWYYKKYKSQTDKPIHYGSTSNPTSAVMRGLNNGYPISTMSAYGTNWTDSDFELFKQTIDDEIAQIKKDLFKFSKVKIGDFRIGQGGRFAKLPQQHQEYLDGKLLEIGIDNTGDKPKIISTRTTPQQSKQISEQSNNIIPKANIPQNLISGVESFGTKQEANSKAKELLGDNPHSIDMIEAGLRTRTTRSASEMQKYNIKVGDIVMQFGKSADGTTKQILTRITAIHPKGTPGFFGTWEKEGWTADGVKAIERFKDGAAAIEFEVIKPNVVNSGNLSPSNTINFPEKNIFTVEPIQSVDKKAKSKAKIATQYIGFAEGIEGSSTENYRQQILAKTSKLFDPNDKSLKKGSVVEYNGKKYLFWNDNNGKAQLINTDGTKFSGTPNLDKLVVIGSYKTTIYNNTEYIVTDNGNIYSGATGNLVYTGKDNSSKVQRERIIASAKKDLKPNIVNSGNYSSNDVIFVSIVGKRGNEAIRKAQQDKTIREAIKALEAGATLITDNADYVESSSYNEGEKRLAANLKAKGYVYSEVIVDGNTLGVWNADKTLNIQSQKDELKSNSNDSTTKQPTNNPFINIGKKVLSEGYVLEDFNKVKISNLESLKHDQGLLVMNINNVSNIKDLLNQSKAFILLNGSMSNPLDVQFTDFNVSSRYKSIEDQDKVKELYMNRIQISSDLSYYFLPLETEKFVEFLKEKCK